MFYQGDQKVNKEKILSVNDAGSFEGIIKKTSPEIREISLERIYHDSRTTNQGATSRFTQNL